MSQNASALAEQVSRRFTVRGDAGARRELLAWAGLVAGVAGVAWGAWRGPTAFPVATATLVVLALVWLQRAGWVRLCGPVLGYDLVRTARRKQFFLLRCLYGIFLLAAFFFVYATWAFDRNAPANQMLSRAVLDPRKLADFASSFFLAFLAMQFLAACLLTPMYTAGALPEDRACRTLEFLLATDLRSREIIISLLLSRLANLSLVILTGLPVLSLLELLGGVDPGLVLAGFAVTGLSMLSLASLGILVSVFARQPRQAVLWTYGWIAAYLVVSGISWLLLVPLLGWASWPSTDTWNSPVTLSDGVEWLNAGNPVAQAIELWRGIGPMTPLDALLPGVLLRYAAFHGAFTILFLAWAMSRLRVETLRQQPVAVRWALPGTRQRWKPRVWNRPLLWKELFAEGGPGLGRLGRIAVGVVVPATFLPALGLVYYQGGQRWVWDNSWESLNGWVRLAGSFVGCVMLASVAVRAAGSVVGERDRQTLDSLLVRPDGTGGILWAKWLGSMAGPWRGWLWLAAIWVVGIVTRALDWRCVSALILAWLIVAAFLAALGLWFSVTTRTAQRAILGTLLVASVCCAGHWLVWIIVMPVVSGLTGGAWGVGWLSEFQALGLTPPMTFAFLAYPAQAAGGWTWADWEWSLVPLFRGALFWLVGAAVFAALASLRFRDSSLARHGLAGPASPKQAVSQGGQRAPTGNSIRRINWVGVSRRAAVASIGILVFLAGWWLTESDSANTRLAAAIAEADRLDPRWRLEELEADRRIVPDEKNASLQVPLIPDERSWRLQRWFPGRQWPTKDLEEALRDLSPEVRLSQKQYALLKANLDVVQPALMQARQLVDYSWGRYPITYSKLGIDTLLPYAQRNRTIAGLLSYDALRRAHERDTDGALASCHAALNAGRSLGDEPFYICQLVRMACRGLALERVERTLAQGEASERAVAKLQRALEDDGREPLLLRGARAERATLDRYLAAIEAGEASYGQYLQMRGLWREGGADKVSFTDRLLAFGGISTRAQRTALLRFNTQVVELSKLPPHEQENALTEFTSRRAQLPLVAQQSVTAGAEGQFVSVRMARIHRWQTARVRCVVAMLAVERYRRANGRWPESLDALVPAQLAHVPADPYDGKPLRYRRLADGVAIYAVGPDLEDNQGTLERSGHGRGLWAYDSASKGLDVGFKLWDVSRRRQLPKESGR
jgi:ABC-type transport system involved in multi-copper enzyme maturation permease subunit